MQWSFEYKYLFAGLVEAVPRYSVPDDFVKKGTYVEQNYRELTRVPVISSNEETCHST